ncbi:MAG: hypothetical protein ACO2O0_11930 [Desulfurococcales archaeon]
MKVNGISLYILLPLVISIILSSSVSSVILSNSYPRSMAVSGLAFDDGVYIAYIDRDSVTIMRVLAGVIGSSIVINGYELRKGDILLFLGLDCPISKSNGYRDMVISAFMRYNISKFYIVSCTSMFNITCRDQASLDLVKLFGDINIGDKKAFSTSPEIIIYSGASSSSPRFSKFLNETRNDIERPADLQTIIEKFLEYNKDLIG